MRRHVKHGQGYLTCLLNVPWRNLDHSRYPGWRQKAHEENNLHAIQCESQERKTVRGAPSAADHTQREVRGQEGSDAWSCPSQSACLPLSQCLFHSASSQTTGFMGNELTTTLKYTLTQVKHIPEPQESTYCSAEQPVYPNTRVYHYYYYSS